MIEIRSLTKKYGEFTAVDDLTLDVRPGEIVGFLGPNGAGKTTTIRILVGLSVPTAGQVRVGGFSLATDANQAKAITGYIPDRPYLYEKLTGREYLQFVTDLYRKDRAASERRAAELLALLGLGDWVDSRIENFSHGMKQKLVIIGALAYEPQVLIIDEPMVGLDALAQRQVRKLLRAEADAGRTILLTTHTMSIAEAVCDRIAILHRGKVVASGTTDELKRAAGQPGSPLEDVFLALTFDDVNADGSRIDDPR